MSQCGQVQNGQFVPGDGSATACNGYLLLTPDEVALIHFLPPLSVSDGFQVGGAILLAWATAFALRQTGRVFRQRDEE